MTPTSEKMDKGFVFPSTKLTDKSPNLPDVVNDF
jgi:hypothetical protein